MKSLDEQIAALVWAITFIWLNDSTHSTAHLAALEAALITLRRIRREIIG